MATRLKNLIRNCDVVRIPYLIQLVGTNLFSKNNESESVKNHVNRNEIL